MTSRAKKPAVTEPPFISASLRDSRFIEEHARAFMEKLEAGKNIEAKSNFQSEINIGIAKFEDKPDQISINLKFTTSVVDLQMSRIKSRNMKGICAIFMK